LGQISNLQARHGDGFALDLFVDARHDFEQGGLARAVGAQHANLGSGEEGQGNVFQNLTLRRHDFADAVHTKNVLSHLFFFRVAEAIKGRLSPRLLKTNKTQKDKIVMDMKGYYKHNNKNLENIRLMPTKPKNYLIIALLAYLATGQQANANDLQQAKWIVKKIESNLCVAQNPDHRGMLLESKKLTIPLKDMSELQAYKVTINDKVVLPTNKPNLVDTSCNCIRVRDMDILKNDVVSVRIDGVTNKNIDVSIKMQIKGIPQAMEELQADNCRKTHKNLAALSVRQ
jgi:hypothetical protein